MTADTEGRPSLRATPEMPEGSGAFVREAGLEIQEVTPTRLVGTITLDARHHTPWGIVHGGVYATAIESAASIGACHAVEDRKLVAVGLTNTTNFVRPMTSGIVTVEARALNQGRQQQLWAVSITDSAGRLVAHGDVRLQNIAPAAVD
ncbi:PaaI family thioesterase [Rhodococcus chondri]|uniref:PaaI family thioesterase n=1 Tax=Rhodococcus chondri TaxID=3065941 RepID=A0ABU7JUS4_9NOCA|nr:PaaI family thioesterase [Rhodococcus sp. CC-R104]MEE2033610.1 PaaI family thioesterase [Rhodococcus sp. CC-R104]